MCNFLSRYIDLSLSNTTFNNIVEIIKDNSVKLDNFDDLVEHVHLVELLEELEQSDNTMQGEVLKREMDNQTEINDIFDEFDDLVCRLCESFNVDGYKVRLFLMSIVHLFKDWNSEYLLVSSFYYLACRDNLILIHKYWDLLSDFNLPLEELVFFYGTILNNEVVM